MLNIYQSFSGRQGIHKSDLPEDPFSPRRQIGVDVYGRQRFAACIETSHNQVIEWIPSQPVVG